MVNLNIPVGVSDFEKLRENNYYTTLQLYKGHSF